MKRIVGYFWRRVRSSFKHKIGETKDKTQYYNVWTNKTWTE